MLTAVGAQRQACLVLLRAHASEGARAMIHELTVGHLDADAIANRVAVSVQPLNDSTVTRRLLDDEQGPPC
jgi:hypothetical protein